MTGASAYASLPQTRVMAIVGSDIGSNVTVHRLLAMDSFNDGVSTFGVISGPDETLQIIAYERQLRLNDNVPLHLLQRVFPDDGFHDYGAAYTDGRSTFYFHSDTNCIYFAR